MGHTATGWDTMVSFCVVVCLVSKREFLVSVCRCFHFLRPWVMFLELADLYLCIDLFRLSHFDTPWSVFQLNCQCFFFSFLQGFWCEHLFKVDWDHQSKGILVFTQRFMSSLRLSFSVLMLFYVASALYPSDFGYGTWSCLLAFESVIHWWIWAFVLCVWEGCLYLQSWLRGQVHDCSTYVQS